MFLTLNAPETTRAALIDREASRREMFASLLRDRGFAISGGYATPAAAIDAAPDIDLAIFHAGHGGAEAHDACATLQAGLASPLLVLVDDGAPELVGALIRAGADQVVPIGVQSDRIVTGAAAAVAARDRFAELISARERAEAALETQKTLARAKGILMSRHGLSEQDAHKRVQELSMQRNLPVRETARAIIDAEALLGAS